MQDSSICFKVVQHDFKIHSRSFKNEIQNLSSSNHWIFSFDCQVLPYWSNLPYVQKALFQLCEHIELWTAGCIEPMRGLLHRCPRQTKSKKKSFDSFATHQHPINLVHRSMSVCPLAMLLHSPCCVHTPKPKASFCQDSTNKKRLCK